MAAILQKAQHRTTWYLLLNNVTGAATGLLFWLLLARGVHLSPGELGVGYAIVALGTTVGLIAKGGLDTALLRSVPSASKGEGARLLRFGALVGGAVALVLSGALALVGGAGAWLPALAPLGWTLVALIAVLLVVTWLQDAYFLAEGDARATFRRNLVLSGTRLLLPVPVVLLALPSPVPLTWMLALAASALAAFWFARHYPPREGRLVPRKEFLRSAGRNITGSAAEFLPGLLLVPLVLAVQGPDAAGYFGMAWTAASLLFLASAAIGRSALSEIVRRGPHTAPTVMRRGVLQSAALLVPGSIAGVLLAPFVMSVFGSDYATAAAPAFAVLCASTLLVAPAYLYLALLRARERAFALVVFPAAMVAALFGLAPVLGLHYGLTGIAMAWLVANLPFGLWGAWRLSMTIKEVNDAPTVRGPSDLE